MVTIVLPNGHRIQTRLVVRVDVMLETPDVHNTSISDIDQLSDLNRTLHYLSRDWQQRLERQLEHVTQRHSSWQEQTRYGWETSETITASEAAMRYGLSVNSVTPETLLNVYGPNNPHQEMLERIQEQQLRASQEAAQRQAVEQLTHSVFRQAIQGDGTGTPTVESEAEPTEEETDREILDVGL